MRKFLNKLLRVPKRTNYQVLQTGVVTESKVFKNKTIITTKSNVEFRYLMPI